MQLLSYVQVLRQQGLDYNTWVQEQDQKYSTYHAALHVSRSAPYGSAGTVCQYNCSSGCLINFKRYCRCGILRCEGPCFSTASVWLVLCICAVPFCTPTHPDLCCTDRVQKQLKGGQPCSQASCSASKACTRCGLSHGHLSRSCLSNKAAIDHHCEVCQLIAGATRQHLTTTTHTAEPASTGLSLCPKQTDCMYSHKQATVG